MTNLEIKHEDGNWHPLDSGLLFDRQAHAYIMTYWVPSFSNYYDQKDIERFLKDGTVREMEEPLDLYEDLPEEDVPVTGASLLRTSQGLMPGVPS